MSSSSEMAPLIPAATVVLIRDASARLEVLMLRRNRNLKAFANSWVFPGGRIDASDAPSGNEDERARAACVREAHEETGLEIKPGGLVRLSHWIPPVQEKRRFSTRFYVGVAPNAPVIIDNGEIHEYRWMCPKEIVSNTPNDEMQIMPPTYVSLAELGKYDNCASAIAGISGAPNELFETKFTAIDGGFVAMWPGDTGYDALDPSLPGPRRRVTAMRDSWQYETH